MHQYTIKSASKRGFITLLALMMSVCLYAQRTTLNGVVIDETDQPLIGATVQVVGTPDGTITDFDGNFSLKVKKGAKITFSYVGYLSKTLTFQGQNKVTVKLEPDNKTLDEVVVVGYGANVAT